MVTKSQLWASVLLISTFAAGAVVGGGVMSAWGERDRNQAQRRPDRERGERGFSATLKRELNLTDAQRDSVRAILRRHDPAFKAVMEGTRPTFDSLRALVHADIKRVLTENQKIAFAQWVARMDSSAARRRAAERDKREKNHER